MRRKQVRPPGIFFRPTKEMLEALTDYGREIGVTASFVASECFRAGFDLWKEGKFTPEPTKTAKGMFASSKTARGV